MTRTGAGLETNQTWEAAMRARAKRLVVIGAVLLWVVSPVMIGGWITVTARASAAGGVSGVEYAALAVWAFVCLIVLLVGFAMLLGGVFMWWRSGRAPAVRRVSGASSQERDAARRAVLLELQESLREEASDDSARGGARR